MKGEKALRESLKSVGKGIKPALAINTEGITEGRVVALHGGRIIPHAGRAADIIITLCPPALSACAKRKKEFV